MIPQLEVRNPTSKPLLLTALTQAKASSELHRNAVTDRQDHGSKYLLIDSNGLHHPLLEGLLPPSAMATSAEQEPLRAA